MRRCGAEHAIRKSNNKELKIPILLFIRTPFVYINNSNNFTGVTVCDVVIKFIIIVNKILELLKSFLSRRFIVKHLYL